MASLYHTTADVKSQHRNIMFSNLKEASLILQVPEKARAELCSLRHPAEDDIQQGLHFMHMQIFSTFYTVINC